MNALTGKVIVINGGTQGLGEAAARACASAGAAGLVLTGRSGARGEALAAELSAAGTPSIMARFGVVHGLANVAAATYRDNVWTATAESFDEMMAVNVRTPLLLTQACGEIMRRENVPGSVVSIGSMSGYGGQPFLTSYCTSKGALMTLTKNLAYSLVRHGIRVNLINAGWMDTESEDAVQRKFHGAQDGWLELAEAGQPLGRLVKPQEVARSIVYCLSDDSGLMSGAIIDFDQGVLGAGDIPKPSAAETPQP
jgi:NAD(P)-dependent dehydrogenase (short-subunit alcohol dehydrogenase family)